MGNINDLIAYLQKGLEAIQRVLQEEGSEQE